MEEAAAGTISAPAAPSPAEPARGEGVLHVALIGNPNTGKSTLFNALTGMRQRVGNYSGVTVERVEGRYRDGDATVTVIDLPGTYSLSASSPDEEIALAVLTGHAPGIDRPDVVVVVVDAANLERNLFLTSQVLELGIPAVVALNQVDAAEAAGIRIDAIELTLELGAPVVPTVAMRGEGLDVLKSAIRKAPGLPRPERRFELPAEAAAAMRPVEQRLTDAGFNPSAAGMEALRLLAVREVGRHLQEVPELEPAVTAARAKVEAAGLSPISLEAESRYGWIADVVDRTVHRAGTGAKKTVTDRVDAIVLHRVFGPLIFVALMAIVFQSIFAWAEPLIGFVEGIFGALGGAVASAIPEGDLQSLIVDGVIGGVGSVLVFLPQIAILFLFIGILEDTGYMARAAFIMDRFMRSVGLHGRSFIPLLSGYACAVPGIMATRTIESRKDRVATIMVLPLMSCSARIPIYTLLIGTFIPPIAVAGVWNLQGITLLAMYLLGTVTALLVASVFKRTLLKGQARPMIMELPPYRLPRPRSLALSVGHRASLFLKKAGTVILALSILLWALATYPKTEASAGMTDQQAQEAQLAGSTLGQMGHAVEPLVRPLGYDWKIGVGILSSFAAREVFVSTMGTIYGVGSDADEGSSTLREKLRNERHASNGAIVYTPLVAVGLMVFYVYAMMCMSTIAVVVRETGGGWTGVRWAAFQFGWMLALAYLSALLVYQGGRALGWG
ncbi:MAG TPA: ferrous iron transport protein B [Longimicrobium sp.]|nr:ferrous iron transport protein B [Longimicrobium sp.]